MMNGKSGTKVIHSCKGLTTFVMRQQRFAAQNLQFLSCVSVKPVCAVTVAQWQRSSLHVTVRDVYMCHTCSMYTCRQVSFFTEKKQWCESDWQTDWLHLYCLPHLLLWTCIIYVCMWVCVFVCKRVVCFLNYYLQTHTHTHTHTHTQVCADILVRTLHWPSFICTA